MTMLSPADAMIGPINGYSGAPSPAGAAAPSAATSGSAPAASPARGAAGASARTGVAKVLDDPTTWLIATIAAAIVAANLSRGS